MYTLPPLPRHLPPADAWHVAVLRVAEQAFSALASVLSGGASAREKTWRNAALSGVACNILEFLTRTKKKKGADTQVTHQRTFS